MENLAPGMLMDIGLQKIKKGQRVDFFDHEKESAFLLLLGSVKLTWEGKGVFTARHSFFDENPSVLHVPAGIEVSIEATEDTEILVQKTGNPNSFESKYYDKEECKSDIFGENVWNDTARRIVKTVFDYTNAPYSNMVLGEVINYPGKWSSYIPHGHRQPEVYFYRFHAESGFGAGFIGDEVFKLTNNSALCIPGGPSHPQVTAPGYPMYYCWMIRHLENDPWISRDNDPAYEWLLEKNVKIWPENMTG
jgi:5-deoxy-glucuronate isomerase